MATQSITGTAVTPTSVLLLGGTGMLGRAWCELLTRRGIPFAAPTRKEFDVGLSRAMAASWVSRFPLVVNCSAWTDVDGAEASPHAALTINGYAMGELMKACVTYGAMLVTYSTDYVFQGRDTPLRVDDIREPINAYGYSKEIGEELIEETDPGAHSHLIIRTSWLYAPWGKNFVRTIANAANEKPSLKVVNDQRGRPTSSEHLAAASLALIEHGAAGIFHVTDGGECTWFDFAIEIARHVNPACRVEPCTTAEFPRPAKRPAYSVMDLSKTEALLGPMPDWRVNLADVLRRLEPA